MEMGTSLPMSRLRNGHVCSSHSFEHQQNGIVIQQMERRSCYRDRLGLCRVTLPRAVTSQALLRAPSGDPVYTGRSRPTNRGGLVQRDTGT